MTSRHCSWIARACLSSFALWLVAACHAAPRTSAASPVWCCTLGLPSPPFPADNPPTAQKIALGRKLFFDRRLSFNGTMSCAMCHIPAQGFTSNELATPVGIEGAGVRRNAPTLLNVAYHAALFHDGRENALETQVWSPLLAANEMGNPSIGHVLAGLRKQPDYRGLFEAAFTGRGPSADTVGQALASYERSLISGDSRFDRFRYGGDARALDTVETRGYQLFTGKAGCTGCHPIGEKTALLSDFRFHNTGIGWQRNQRLESATRVDLAPGVHADLSVNDVAHFGEAPAADAGRFEVTLNPSDRWAYKTPMLRNVARTAPYMHDGSIATLEAVVAYYNRGGAGAPDQSALIRPLLLDTSEQAALVAFLRTLDGKDRTR